MNPGAFTMPEITLSGVCSSIIFSTIGFWLFKQGKLRTQFSLVGIGIALMAYSYFTHGPLQDWGGGVVLCALAYWVWHHD
jgi:hypothetical protein